MSRPVTEWTPEQRRQRASIAARARHRPDDPEIAEARRELRTSRLVDHVRAVVDAAPPLTVEQRERVAAALHAPMRPETA